MRRFLIPLILLAVLWVAGCSGGGGGSVQTPLPDQALPEVGRFLAFCSTATNLVPVPAREEAAATNGTVGQVYVVDRQTGDMDRVSLSSEGAVANNWCEWPTLSWDGRFVAFFSSADNLVPNDSNQQSDIFVHDRTTGETTRVSVASSGAQADGYSRHTSIAGYGDLVAFRSGATNLVQNDTNGCDDIFVHDRTTGLTERVSVATGGAQANGDSRFPALSADGRRVAFQSEATNLVPEDTSNWTDIYVHDRAANTTVLVSVASDGTPSNGYCYDPSISADGRFVVFSSSATNLVEGDTNDNFDIFRHDLLTGQTVRVSLDENGIQFVGQTKDPWLSPDGSRASFTIHLYSNNGVQAEQDSSQIYVRDIDQEITWLASANLDGQPGNWYCYESLMGLSATSVFFGSGASDLVEGDTNQMYDVFERDLVEGVTRRISVGSEGAQADGDSYLFLWD